MAGLFDEADNFDPETDDAGQGRTVSPTDGNAPSIDTKAYSERLNKDRAKIAEDVRNEIAQSFGFATYDEFLRSRQDETIRAAGLDPVVAKPVLEKLVNSDPVVLAAKRSQSEQSSELLKQKERDDLFALNSKYGTQFTSLEEIDDATKALYEKGVPLDKAYGVEHLSEVSAKSHKVASPSKGHLQNVTGSSSAGSSNKPPLDAKQMAIFRKMLPNVSDEEITKFYNNN